MSPLIRSWLMLERASGEWNNGEIIGINVSFSLNDIQMKLLFVLCLSIFSLKPIKFIERSRAGTQMLCLSFSPGTLYPNIRGFIFHVAHHRSTTWMEINKFCDLVFLFLRRGISCDREY